MEAINNYSNNQTISPLKASDYWASWSTKQKIGAVLAAVIAAPVTLSLAAAYGFDRLLKSKKNNDEKNLRALLDHMLFNQAPKDTITVNAGYQSNILLALKRTLEAEDNKNKECFAYLSRRDQTKILNVLSKIQVTEDSASAVSLTDQHNKLITKVLLQYKSQSAYWSVMLAKVIALAVGIASGVAILGFAIPTLASFGLPLLSAMILGTGLAITNAYLNFGLFKGTSRFIQTIMRGQSYRFMRYFVQGGQGNMVKNQVSPTNVSVAFLFVIGASLVSTFFAYKGISVALASVVGMGALASPVGLVLAGCLFIGSIALYAKAYVGFFKKGDSLIKPILKIYRKATEGKILTYKTVYAFGTGIVFLVSLAMNILGGILTGPDLAKLTQLGTPTSIGLLITLNVGAQFAFNMEIALQYAQQVLEETGMGGLIKRNPNPLTAVAAILLFPALMVVHVLRRMVSPKSTEAISIWDRVKGFVKTIMIMMNATANGLGAYSATNAQIHRFYQAAGTCAFVDSASTYLAESKTQARSQDVESELGIKINTQRKSP